MIFFLNIKYYLSAYTITGNIELTVFQQMVIGNEKSEKKAYKWKISCKECHLLVTGVG